MAAFFSFFARSTRSPLYDAQLLNECENCRTPAEQRRPPNISKRPDPELKFASSALMIEKLDVKLRLLSVMAAVSLLTFGGLVEAYRLLT
jgi:hypothetical protein